jgi:inhibitor of cysteine peptidase
MQPTSGAGFRHKEWAVFVAVVIGVAAFIAAISTQGHTMPIPSPTPVVVAQGLENFQNTSQLEAFVNANAKSAQQYGRSGIWLGGPQMVFGVVGTPIMLGTVNTMATATAVQSAAIQSPPSFTGTNVQVQGVDEPDRVKTDGKHLFVSNNDAVAIINAYPPNSTSTLSTLRFPKTSVLGLEIYQNRLLVIDLSGTATASIRLLLYDTSDLAAPKLVANTTIPGSYVAARMADGYAYAVIQQPSYQFSPRGNATAVLPYAVQDGLGTPLPPTSVYRTSDNAQISFYTVIASLSMTSGKSTTLSVLTGPSSTIYVSTSNIYVVYTAYPDLYDVDGILGNAYTGGVISQAVVRQSENSTVVRAAYANGSVTAATAGSVPGTVLNQFSMDEYSGYFRIATSHFATIGGTPTRSDDIYVLDSSLHQVSALVNIAPGENIYAVRFVGDMGYVVTFQQIDPLFVVSFKDMAEPVILSALKVNGYSDYLHPLPGGYLIGVGKDSVPASNGNFAYYLGLKLSLFHVLPNGTSLQVSKYLIGDRGTDSPVLTDHLAFTFDSSKNITVIPLTLALVSGSQGSSSQNPPPYGDVVWQGAYVFSVNSAGFTLLGRVSQYPAGQNYGDSPNSQLQIDRSVIIGNYLYTISQSEVMANSLSNFSTVSTVQLPG